MFLDNKYTKVYYQIINRALSRPYKKVKNDGYQKHHIIPKCIGGTDSANNLVILNYKEHRVCHCLLIKMQLTKPAEIKMRHAYGFFNKSSRYNGPRYKRGKDNIFSTKEIVEQVRKRMTENNPMKDPALQQKRVDTWRANRAARDYIPPRVLKDKFITPNGIFKTKKEIQKALNIPEWTLNTIYNDLDALPISNGRGSKKITHLNINPSLTWRDNGFGLLAVS
jgi:hypothetical protein